MSLVKFEASFDASNPEQLTAAINFLSALKTAGGTQVPNGGEQAETTKIEEAPKKRAPRKKKAAEAPKTEETPTAENATGPGNPTEEKKESTSITLEDIRTLTSAKAQAHRAEIKSKLTEMGAANVAKIPEDKYAEFAEFLESL
jgi:hypothetical protein